jgi:Asp-tRNA(Asn)/Glu-tRNA(Gln) amidotransferase A subunit family amidase
MLDVMGVADPDDPHSSPWLAPPTLAREDLTDVRVGVPQDWFWDELDPQVEAAAQAVLDLMTRVGATMVSVPIDIAALAPLLVFPLQVEAYVFHQPTLEAHPELYSPRLRHMLLAGQYALAQDYIRALRVRRLAIEAVRRALEGVDVLAMPTMPTLPLRIADACDPDAPAVAALMRKHFDDQPIRASGHQPTDGAGHRGRTDGIPTRRARPRRLRAARGGRDRGELDRLRPDRSQRDVSA